MANLSDFQEYLVIVNDAVLGCTFTFEVSRIGYLYYIAYADYDYIGIGHTPNEAAQDIMFNAIRPSFDLNG